MLTPLESRPLESRGEEEEEEEGEGGRFSALALAPVTPPVSLPTTWLRSIAGTSVVR